MLRVIAVLRVNTMSAARRSRSPSGYLSTGEHSAIVFLMNVCGNVVRNRDGAALNWQVRGAAGEQVASAGWVQQHVYCR